MKIKHLKFINELLIIYVFLTSFLVVFFWLADRENILINENYNLVIKFNTSVLLFLSVLAIIIFYYRIKHFKYYIITIASFIILVSFITLLEYGQVIDFSIDNLVVKDFVSKQTYSGRMSFMTAICFIIYAIGMVSIVGTYKWFNKFAHSIYFILPLFAILNIIAVIFKIIVGAENIEFVDQFAIEAPIAFLIISYLLLFHFQNMWFKSVVFGRGLGSRVLRRSIPLIISIPLVIGYFVLEFINKDFLSSGFGIILYTVALIISAFIIMFITALYINKSYKLIKKAEANLKTRNLELTQFKYAIDQVAIIAILDEKFNFKYVNGKFCEFFKYNKSEILGQNNHIIKSDEHNDAFFDEIWKTISSGSPWIGEIKNVCKNKEEKWTSTAIVPFVKNPDQVKEYVIIKYDISQQKRKEQSIESAYVTKLEQKNKELEQYTYIASHDLQEPLRTIASLYEILNQEYGKDFDDNAKQILSFIQSAIQRMSQLIKNLLDYSRIGQSETLEKIDFNILIDEIKADLKSLITRKKATIISENLPELYVYPTSMRLLMQNLINNAIKFTKKDVDPVVKIEAKLEDDYWIFKIIDNGIGIAKEHQEKIFSIFQRLHLREEYEGTGIGLAHCKKIITLHDGELWVESEQNKGSVFYFKIPNNLE